MSQRRTLLGPEGPDFADPKGTLARADLLALVDGLRGLLAAEGLAGGRVCLPLDAGLGSLAALVAVIEGGGSAAPVPRPGPDEATDWPAFCDAVLHPPGPGEGPEAARIERLPGARDRGDGEDRVYVRTSGTTGAAKWTVHDATRILASGRASAARLGLTAEDRVLLPVPIHHSYGLSAGLLSALQAGCAVALAPRGNPLEVFKAQRTFQPTVMFTVPSQCRSIMALGRSAGRARVNVAAGDRLFPDEAAAFEAAHGTLVNLYGTSETNAMTAGDPADPAELRHLTAGPPLDGVELALEDGPDEARTMRVRARDAFLGYADARGDVAAPAPETWATGDLVRLHGEGALANRVEVLGRSDLAVNRDGLLVHMGEVEVVLLKARGVVQAAVVAAGQSRRGAGLVAFCALDRPGTATAEELLRHCRTLLPPRAVPDRLELRQALPMLPSGKVDRVRLAAEAG